MGDTMSWGYEQERLRKDQEYKEETQKLFRRMDKIDFRRHLTRLIQLVEKSQQTQETFRFVELVKEHLKMR